MKKIVLGSACAAALLLCAGAASAAGFNANISGSYANISGGGGDVYNVDGAIQTGFGGNWGAELTGGYHNTTGGDLGNLGAAVFYGEGNYRLAASVNYLDLSALHLTTFGLGGEWYASNNFTIAARAGYGTGQFGIDGEYVGADVKWYATPDLALSGGVNYIDLNGFTELTSENIRAEWLVSQTTPVSLFGGFTHADASGSSEDIFFVGVKLYTNSAGPAPLVDRQRSGNLGYIDGVPYLGEAL